MTKNRLTCCLLIMLVLFSAHAVFARDGLTWSKTSHDSTNGTDYVNTSGGNAYVGDTDCNTTLPILCIKNDFSPIPPGFVPGYYNGWVGGHIALTLPLPGTALTSLVAADSYCDYAHGRGYRMAEFHDGGGGWGWTAYGNVNPDTRFWVYIDDQPANCWN